MSNKENGGPAFPCQEAEYRIKDGMTLRDYFSTHATEEDIRAAMVMGESFDSAEDRANARYRHADAMLEARK